MNIIDLLQIHVRLGLMQKTSPIIRGCFKLIRRDANKLELESEKFDAKIRLLNTRLESRGF